MNNQIIMEDSKKNIPSQNKKKASPPKNNHVPKEKKNSSKIHPKNFQEKKFIQKILSPSIAPHMDSAALEVILEREILGPAVDLVVNSQLKAVSNGCKYFSQMLELNTAFTVSN